MPYSLVILLPLYSTLYTCHLVCQIPLWFGHLFLATILPPIPTGYQLTFGLLLYTVRYLPAISNSGMVLGLLYQAVNWYAIPIQLPAWCYFWTMITRDLDPIPHGSSAFFGRDQEGGLALRGKRIRICIPWVRIRIRKESLEGQEKKNLNHHSTVVGAITSLYYRQANNTKLANIGFLLVRMLMQ